MALTSMEEAFKKAGFEEAVNKREVERKKKEQEESERIIQEEHRQREENQRQNEEIRKRFQPFDDRWRDPKKQKFLVHLIFAYIPIDVAYHPWTNEELREKKCCICEQALISKEFIFANAEKFVTRSVDQITRMARGEAIHVRKEFEKDFGNVVMAVVSPKSSAAFCTPCFHAFYDWIQIMILQGNQQINRIVRRRQLECALSAEQLKEYDALSKEKNVEERRKKLKEFLEKMQNEKMGKNNV